MQQGLEMEPVLQGIADFLDHRNELIGQCQRQRHACAEAAGRWFMEIRPCWPQITVGRVFRCVTPASESFVPKLLHLRVLGLGLLQDWDVGVGVFPEVEKVLATRASRLGFLQENNVRIEMAAQNSETLSIRRQAE
jgi:hypothetical protein